MSAVPRSSSVTPAKAGVQGDRTSLALDSRLRGNDGFKSDPTMKLAIDYAICNSCGLCREVCPESAVRPKLLEPRHLYEIQPEKCTGCGECLPYCPAPGALVQLAA